MNYKQVSEGGIVILEGENYKVGLYRNGQK